MEELAEPLIETPDKAPSTASGLMGVVMIHTSGQDDEVRWFDYKPTFYADAIRVVWDHDTMAVAIPAETADYLLKNGYARPMTADEVAAYNEQLKKPETEPEKAEKVTGKSKSKKEKTDD